MIRGISAAFVVAGIVMVVWGVQVSRALGSDLSRFFTGTPTDKAMWLLIGGATAITAGAIGLLRGDGS